MQGGRLVVDEHDTVCILLKKVGIKWKTEWNKKKGLRYIFIRGTSDEMILWSCY